jgi:hypothetical protein
MRKLGFLAVVFLQAVVTTVVNGETQNAHSNLFITETIASEILKWFRRIPTIRCRLTASSLRVPAAT